jgi:four helix bundle protein
MKGEDLKKRTKKFAHDCVATALQLPNTYLANHIKGQLIRCSTSVAANYRAVCRAQTKPVFIDKLRIVIEESDESNFWLEFIGDEKLLSKDQIEKLLKESDELVAIFVASRKTATEEKQKINL